MVVGAGLSGLSAALHLLGAGRRVTVVERADYPGGRAGALDLETRGYRVDPGPTVLTMPDLLEEALARRRRDQLEERLDLSRSTRPTGPASPTDRRIDVHTDADAMEAEIRRGLRAGRGGRLPAAARAG